MNRPGVYVMYAEDGTCLYVGSSVNMKRRISSHKYRNMAYRIEYNECKISELREKEEEIFLQLNPTLNKAKCIYRPGEPSRVRCPPEALILHSRGTYWTWMYAGISFDFRTISRALSAFKLIKAIATPELAEIGRISYRSMYDDPILMG